MTGNAAVVRHGNWTTAPSHRKPPMPSAGELAARLRQGERLDVIAQQLDRAATTLTTALSHAGYTSTGHKQKLVPDAPAAKEPRPARRGAPELRLLAAIEDDAWRDEALCAQTDPELFFPDKGGSTREAKKVCRECPVREECLRAALANDERFGILGGLSPQERRRLKRRGRGALGATEAKPHGYAAMRAWAAEAGIACPTTAGNVPSEVREAYYAARPEAAPEGGVA